MKNKVHEAIKWIDEMLWPPAGKIRISRFDDTINFAKHFNTMKKELNDNNSVLVSLKEDHKLNEEAWEEDYNRLKANKDKKIKKYRTVIYECIELLGQDGIDSKQIVQNKLKELL